MTIYDEFREIASDLFAEFGQGVIDYVKVVPGAGPRDNPGPATKTTYRINGTARGASFKYVSTGLALVTDQEINTGVDDRFTPSPGDMVTVDGVPYKIVQAIGHPSSGLPVSYTLIARHG